MRFMPIRRWLWWSGHAVGAFGWPGALAMLLSVALTFFIFLSLKPMQDRIAVLQHDAKSLRLQSTAGMPGKNWRNPAEQLSEFYRFFPPQASMPTGMAALYDAAAKNQLTLEQAEYRLAHDRDSKLTRYEVVLPVNGGYIQIRKFIAQVLTDVPSMSLDGITFNRQKIGDTGVDAQIRLTFYLGAQ